MGVASLLLGMFLRKLKNRSGSIWVQIISLSLKKAAELTHTMYQITYTLPESKHTKTKLLKMDDQQAELYNIIHKNT